eukprot:3772888-Karenia_brevis.AAC.1
MATRKVGLEIHPEKTKVLTNSSRQQGGHIEIPGGRVKVLVQEEGTDYLGRKLCLTELHDIELEARLDKAWGKFH